MLRSRSEYGRSILTLVTGTTIAQAIPIAISPILTRLYTPDDFGFFALYFSTSTVLGVIATAKYEMAITLPEDESKSRSLVQLSITIAVVLSILLAVIVALFHNAIAAWLGIGQPEVLYFLPVSLLIIGVNQSLYYFLNRKKNYKMMAASRVVRSTGYSVTSVAAGIFRGGGPLLVVSDLFGQILSAVVILFRDRTKFYPWHRADVAQVAREYQNFPRYSIVSGILEKLASNAPVFLITKLFVSTSTVGFFSFAQRIIISPSDLITRAISDVFRQQASESYFRAGECRAIFLSTFKRLLAIAIVPAIVGFFFVEDAFAFIFGEEWRIAGTYAKIMLPMFFLQFIVSPLSIMFVIAQKQKYDLLMQCFLLGFVVLSFYWGYTGYQSVEKCITFFTLVYCIKYIIEFLLSYRFSLGKQNDTSPMG